MLRLKRLGWPFVFVVLAALVTAALTWWAAPPDGPPPSWLVPYCRELAPCGCVERGAFPEPTCPPGAGTRTVLSKPESDAAQAVVKRRLDHYESELGALRTNLWLQLSLIVFAILVVRRERNEAELEIPFLKIKVPSAWSHLLIPVALVYLFVAFGFLFDHMIQERYLLWEQLRMLEAPRSGRSIHSMRMLLEDRWVMDSWFAEFHADQSAVPVETTGAVAFNVGMLVLFSLFVALQHAVALFLLTRREFPLGRGWQAACLGVSVVLLGFAHFGFRVFGGNPNWLQLLVGGSALLMLGLWLMRSPHGFASFGDPKEQDDFDTAELERRAKKEVAAEAAAQERRKRLADARAKAEQDLQREHAKATRAPAPPSDDA